MINILNLSKSFESKQVFDSFNLDLKDGLIYCLMGPSGCGKTTLLRLFSRLESPDAGEIRGFKPLRPSFVFQEDRLIETSSVTENVNLVLKHADGSAEKWLKALGLGNELDAFPVELSGGMRRRVSLARAMAHAGDAYFMDEPFTGIDPEAKARLIPAIRAALAGKTAFVATHDEVDAALIGDIIIRLSEPPQKTAALENVK